MRRTVLMLGVTGLAAMVLPVPALAEDSGGTVCPPTAVPAAATPMGVDGCPGVRPGGRLMAKNRLCTLNFLFRAPDGTRYIGTAGHCMSWLVAWFPEKAFSVGSGPEALDGDGNRIGEFAYAVFDSDDHHGLTKDFALIRLDPDVDASPEMCHFGAPSGMFTTDTADPVVLHYYGHGTATPARTGVAFGTPNPDRIYAMGVVLEGDGGGGVMTGDGQAVGDVTGGPAGIGFHPGPFGAPIPGDPPLSEKGGDVGTIGITRLAPQVARASEQLAVPLDLVTG